MPHRNSRSIAALCKLLVGLQVFSLIGWAQDQNAPVTALNIVILDSDGAINNIKQRTAREAIVRVEDQNHKPVAGALVLFAAPDNGPGGTFVDGLKSLQVTTDENGRAQARFHPNATTGAFVIKITAMFQGQSATAEIRQTNATGGGDAGGSVAPTTGFWLSGRTILIISAVAAGAIAAGFAARGGSSTTVSAGTATVGPPR